MPISIETARSYLDAGLAVLPAVRERKCPATGKWKKWKSHLPTECEIKAWFANQPDAVCIVCGKVSGNLEIIDFDNHGELFEKWKAKIAPELFEKLIVERTPSGGYHVIYRCDEEVCGNLKLAQGMRNGKAVTLIETRGEGGLFLCAPTPGYVLSQGSFASFFSISGKAREALLEAAWSLNEIMPEPVNDSHVCGSSASFAIRPGDAFNQSGDLRPILTAHGWESTGKDGDNELFRRPGKAGKGCSASLKNNVFYVFSSNAAPFEANKGYSAFNVYAMLEHNGDFTQAAKTLLERGYGTPAATTPGVDLSGFMVAAEPPKEDAVLSLAELEERYPKLRPPIIHGLLREGETMNIIAAPKTGKSWLVLDLALAVAAGRDWQGFPCEPGKVLIIDNELHPETSANRIRKVRDARGMALSRIGDKIFIDNQRGSLKDINELAQSIALLDKHKFKLVIIDAFYRAMPVRMDENDNGGMAKLYNAIDRYAKALGCSFVLIHHTSKGNQSIKSVTDVGSGAGAQSRAADAHLILRRHKDEDIVVLESVVRSFQPNPPICLRWNYPLWNVDLTLDPKQLDGIEEELPKRKKADVGELAVMVAEIVPEEGMPKTQLIIKAQAQLELSREKSRNAIAVGIELGLLDETDEIDSNNRKRSFKKITRCG